MSPEKYHKQTVPFTDRPPPLSPKSQEAIRICADFNMDPDPRILTDPDPALFFSDFQYANKN